VARLLERNGLKASDVQVYELHEAFAGQVLANLNALDSDEFARTAGVKAKVGAIDHERINTRGGSCSLGHPFGATGTRLLFTASNRLHEEDGQYAVLAACAAGGLGHAMLIERV
jgi:acetyl-CoA acyltransferase